MNLDNSNYKSKPSKSREDEEEFDMYAVEIPQITFE